MMVRAVIAVLLGCLLSLSVTAANVTLSAATPSLGAKGDLLKFTQITDTAPWPGRRMAFVKQLPTSLSFKPEGSTKTTTLVNPLILVGGFDPAWNQAEQNDVWASRDAKTWYLVSGTTFDGDSAATVSYDVFQGPCCGYSGNTAMLTTESGYTLIHVAEDVWSTTNTVTWKPVAQSGSYPYTQRNLASPLVVTSTNHIIRIAGQGGDNNAFQNDVLMSADSGKSWKVMTDMAPFTERFTATTFSLQNPSNLEGKDIVYVIGGRSTRDNYNDVWASSDDGKTWMPINPSAPFMQRNSAGGTVTKDGILVVVGGFADDDEGQFNQKVANDVWVSMDGGYSWYVT